ncbi:MAG: mechanosensitive ion channel family protein [Ruminococcaceae bacterium]|nr:mechanosensitive ion channel family protein [Oscillospiraceae bacterium]
MGKFFEDLLKELSQFTLGKLLPALILLVAGLAMIKIILRIVKAMLKKSKLDAAAHSLIRSVVKVVLLILLGLIVASSLGVDVTGIVALASVLTLAISLSVQDLLSNVFGGFTLLYTRPFAAGDFVEIAGQTGSIIEIGLAYTKLNTADNKLVSIPNSAVVSAEIVNYTANGTRRAELMVTASYDAPVEVVLSALREAADLETVEKTPEIFVAVNSYGDHSIQYVLRFWSKNENYGVNYFGVNKRIKEIFDARGIQMTYPHLNVHLDK